MFDLVSSMNSFGSNPLVSYLYKMHIIQHILHFLLYDIFLFLIVYLVHIPSFVHGFSHVMQDIHCWRCYYQIIIEGIPRVGWTFSHQAQGTYGKGSGSSQKGPLFHILQAPSCFWSCTWSKFLEGNPSLLQYELRTKDVHKKTLDACVLLCNFGPKTCLTQVVEWIKCSTRGKKIPNIWFLWLLVCQMAPQGDILAPSQHSIPI